MQERTTLILYGLKVFVVFFGLAEIAGYLTRSPDASVSDLARGAVIAACISVIVSVVATYALKHSGNDSEP